MKRRQVRALALLVSLVLATPAFIAAADMDSLKTVNVGLAGGAGIAYPLGPGDLVLEARFELGLTIIQKDVATSGESRTGAVIVSLGYSLPLGRSH